MKSVQLTLLAILLLLGLQSCMEELEDPAYSEVPHIELEEAQITLGRTIDTLSITISFRDGNSDLGLGAEDNIPPFHELDFPIDSSGDYILFDSKKDIYDCRDFMYWRWPADSGYNEYMADTVRYVRNEYYFNFKVDLLIEEEGEYKKYDYSKNCSQGLGGRFPRIDSLGRGNTIKECCDKDYSTFEIYQKTPWEGKITYTAISAFRSRFRQKSIKFRIYIYDRALNESNVVESEPFFF